METSGGGGGAGCLFIIALILGGLAFFVVTPVGVEQSIAPAVEEEAVQVPNPVFALEDIPCGTLITPELTTPYPMEVMINQYTTTLIPAGEEIDPATLSETFPDCSG